MAQGEELVLNVKSDIGKVVEQTEKLDAAAKKGQKGFAGIGKAIKGVGTALKAAGIGIVVALLAKLMDVFRNNQKVLDAFDTGMTALNIAFNDLFDFLNNNIGAFTGFFKDIFENPQESLKAFGDMIEKNIIERFNSLLDTFGFVGSALSSLFKGNFKEAGEFAKMAGKEMVDVATGIDNSFDKTVETVTKAAVAVTDYSKKVIENAGAITEQNKAAEKAAVEFEKLNAQFLKDAEDQRQIRDDETKTFAKRIEANNELNKILIKQGEEQKRQIQIKIDAAQAQFDINDSDANFIALEREKIALLQVEEAINGQMSEQKTNAVALEKELLETQNEVRAEGMSGMQRELLELEQNYKLKLDMARKSGMDTTAIEKQYARDKKAILKDKTDAEIDMANQGLQALADAAGEGTAIAKAAAIAQATMAGTQSVLNAFNSANANVGATATSFGAYPVTMAGLAATFAAMNIAKIASGGGGAVSPPSSGAGAAAAGTPAPQMMSGAFDITGGVAPDAMRAYVVTDEMTNSQNQLANIRRRATI